MSDSQGGYCRHSRCCSRPTLLETGRLRSMTPCTIFSTSLSCTSAPLVRYRAMCHGSFLRVGVLSLAAVVYTVLVDHLTIKGANRHSCHTASE